MPPLRPPLGFDTRPNGSASLHAPDPSAGERIGARVDPRAGWPMEPSRAALVVPIPAAPGQAAGMSDLAVQPSKIQAPPLRDQTLSRDRLLDWLSVKIHNRIVLVIAEAGYGKTTLLADFSRRTRVRTLWYRLDAGDRDPIVFLRHIVGAVRARIPDGCEGAFSLLSEVGPTGPGLDTIVEALLRGLQDLPPDPTALIFDDHHLIDDAPEVRRIGREIVERAPERLSIVFASRRTPSVPIARLRAQGEVAELRTADLRFDEAETERLFRDTYAMPLEPRVAADLARRTEGWAASLQLVQNAIRGRTAREVRAFVGSLTGAEGELYEYLAEEVVGDLPDELQSFLMRTAVLETVDPDLGAVAAEVSADDARRLIEDAERVGLFGRRGSGSRHAVRAHPLVRDFLLARLERTVGAPGVATINRSVARAAEASDWALAAGHYRSAGDLDDVQRVLAVSIEAILASGAYGTAGALVAALEGRPPDAATLVIRSREAMQRGDTQLAVELADAAVEIDPSRSLTALNSMTARFANGDLEGALLAASNIAASSAGRPVREMARAVELMLLASVGGGLRDAVAALRKVVESAPPNESPHYRGVASLNLANFYRAMGDASEALRYAEEAVATLEATSAAIELTSARLARAWALAHLGRLAEARAELDVVAAAAVRESEVRAESAEIELLYGDPARARSLLSFDSGQLHGDADAAEQVEIARAHLALVDGDTGMAGQLAKRFRFGRIGTVVAIETRRRLVEALASPAGSEAAQAVAFEGIEEVATRQGAEFWVLYGKVARGLLMRNEGLDSMVREVARQDPSYLSMHAESLASRLSGVSDEAVAYIRAEASRRPERWRPALRQAIDMHPTHEAATVLEEVGTLDDVRRLRGVAKILKGTQGAAKLGRALARRLAPRVWVEDQGRVEVKIGTVTLAGSGLRRKVLAFLCLLLTKPGFSATRDEVLDRLWPDFDPETALNSLNQTVYFLRRVFEPAYSEDLSPGYLGQDTETVWLDSELVGSRSARCRSIIRALPATPTPDQVWGLAQAYRGRFALDFAYEDWATDYRDTLHASYLRVIETSVRQDLDGGHFPRGIAVAERALEIDPDSDSLQASLVRLYRLSGVHAAAAEQYGHYSSTLRGLGVVPPPIDDV